MLLRDRGLRKVGSDVTAEALLRGAHASAALAGSPATLDEVRRGDADGLATGRSITGELMRLAPRIDTAPVQVWTRLHQLAAADLGPEDRRAICGPVGSRCRTTSGAAAGARCRRDVGAAERAGTESDPPTTAPGLVVAAIVHAELAILRPFPTANGLVARAAERCLLVARGIDLVAVTVPEVGHYELAGTYPAGSATTQRKG